MELLSGWRVLAGVAVVIEMVSVCHFKYKRSILDSILDGTLKNASADHNDFLGFDVPTECPKVPNKIIKPRNTCSDGNAYDNAAFKMANMFQEKFKQFEEGSSYEIILAGSKAS